MVTQIDPSVIAHLSSYLGVKLRGGPCRWFDIKTFGRNIIGRRNKNAIWRICSIKGKATTKPKIYIEPNRECYSM